MEAREILKELRKRQKYLEAIFSSVPDAIVTTDAAHGVVEWNPAAERIFGYTQEEAKGKNLDDLVAKGDVEGEARGFRKQVFSGEPLPPVETVRYRKDGTRVNVIASGAPIVIDNRLEGVVTVLREKRASLWPRVATTLSKSPLCSRP